VNSSKTLKIAIPVIAVIAIGIFIGVTAMQSENQISSGTESNAELEEENSEDVSLNDPKVTNSSKLSDTKKPILTSEITEVYSTSQVIDKVEEEQLLRKTIPSNYKFGNFFDNSLLIGMTHSELEDSNQIHSIRFTNKYDGEINNISIKLFTDSEREVIVGIQEDNGKGNPNGIWNSEESYLKSSVLPKQGSYSFELPKSFKVLKDEVYHIVIQLSPDLSENENSENSNENGLDNSSFSVVHYKGNTPHQPFNPQDPDIYWPDNQINSLQYNGEEWIILDKWPIYLLSYQDGKVDGQPYTLKAHWVVRENRPVGQAIIPHSDYKVSKFAFMVSKKGSPGDDLYYGIQDNDNKLLASGVFAKSSQLTTKASFIEVVLDEPINFNAGNLYRFFVYSPIPKGDDNYNLFGLEFSLNNAPGYGGEINRLTTSSDFKNWGPWYDADAVFALHTIP